MLRTNSKSQLLKGISIITNFGCPFDCHYCIWKFHSLCNTNKQTLTKHDFIKFFNLFPDVDKVSISGGGDPFFEFERHGKDFWDPLFDVCSSFNKRVDVHTRIQFNDIETLSKLNKIVFSVDVLTDDIKQYLEWLRNYVKIRINKVVTKNTVEKDIEEFVKFVSKFNLQLSLRQLSQLNDEGTYVRLKEKFPHLFFLDNADYNYYLMPDGTITDKFLF